MDAAGSGGSDGAGIRGAPLGLERDLGEVDGNREGDVHIVGEDIQGHLGDSLDDLLVAPAEIPQLCKRGLVDCAALVDEGEGKAEECRGLRVFGVAELRCRELSGSKARLGAEEPCARQGSIRSGSDWRRRPRSAR